jgi:hypothetical protein
MQAAYIRRYGSRKTLLPFNIELFQLSKFGLMTHTMFLILDFDAAVMIMNL